jgi:hypothetical protein
MKRVFLWMAVFGGLGLCCGAAEPRIKEITDPAVAAKDPDFAVQGEYLGQASDTTGSPFDVGAQVIALGSGRFSAEIYQGGLPGMKNWKRNKNLKDRLKLEGARNGKEVVLSMKSKPVGKIVGETLTIDAPDMIPMKLKRTVRKSPTLGAKPPKGAVVLFDGTSADQFTPGVMTKDKNLLSEETSKKKFGSCKLHLEFRLSYMPRARGQARSNSGVYLHDCYEVQVLDSFGLEGDDHECGGFYGIRRPDVNMCFPPLTWQTYDVDFTAPKYEGGKKTADARITVKQNGVTIHDNFALPHATPGREDEGPAPHPLYLQGHGNKVEYRNIWVVEKKDR